MNVVLHGILPLLTLTTVLVVAVLPVVGAQWMHRAMAVAVTLGQRLMPGTQLLGVTLAPASSRRVPMDVVPAHQAWRAPPTVHPQSAVDDPADTPVVRRG